MEWLMTICAESTYIFENFLIIFGFCALMEPKSKRPVRSIFVQVLFIYLFQKVSAFLSFYFTNASVFSVTANVIMMLAVSYVFYKGALWKRFLSIAMYLVPAFSSEAIAWPLTYQMLTRTEGVDLAKADVFGVTIYRNLAIIFCGQIILILWAIALLLWKVCAEKRWIKEFFLFIVIPVYQMIIFMVYYSSCETIDIASIIIGWFLYLFGFFIDGAILYLISGMVKKMQMEKELRELYRKRQEELTYYMMVNSHIEEVRQMRHEFANQLQVMYGLLEVEDEGKVKEMLDAICGNIESRIPPSRKGQGNRNGSTYEIIPGSGVSYAVDDCIVD